ncbi:MAG: PIG-L family deacetylase [Candidatus Abyssobacteria bacterium SURF_17]|uniref:PIG-L family deacetylase n=1 Tax=Candidatus Abyssobacteria bacterium SURF_17 TaxID=2093361 RepID=A0A419EWV1_9BACT|nr:MAG: PIG-L family deacetylase [Candidatus Abyssubacteria bacterium SURF_17]
MRYLVVEPHPDDLVFFCGGTVAKLLAEGHEVHTLVVTDGEQGTLNRSYDTDKKLASVMREEELAACKVLGVEHVTFLGLKNHFLEPTHDLREKIVRHVRKIQPAAVLTIDPWNFDENPDHRAVGQVVLEACSFAHFHLFHPEHIEEGLETAMVAKVIFGKTPSPNTYVDISQFVEKKIAAALCYKSQIELMQMEGAARLKVLGKSSPIFDSPLEEVIPASIRMVAEEEGSRANLPMAESFHVRGLGILENIKDLVGGLDV